MSGALSTFEWQNTSNGLMQTKNEKQVETLQGQNWCGIITVPAVHVSNIRRAGRGDAFYRVIVRKMTMSGKLSTAVKIDRFFKVQRLNFNETVKTPY